MNNHNQCDVLIIGSGIAGLYAALQLDSSLKVIILTKDRLEESNSYLAQGGIAAVMDQETDKPEDHFNDTVRAGAGICNRQALEVLVNEAAPTIANLQRLGVNFDREQGQLSLTREGGHRRARILHIDGDATGKGITDVLIRKVQSRTNIKIIEYSFCMDLLVHNHCCFGAVALEQEQWQYYYAQSVILATGGIGMIYGITTNACTLTGDALTMAERAGAEITDMEFIQFHPTVFYHQRKRRFLISEAVRGEGAVLKNIHGEKFMHKYDERRDLAPRDIVSRAIIKEMAETQAEHVFLDLTHLDKDYIFRRFPNITAKCKEYGVDLSSQMIPVRPAQHYLMGGIKTDLWARTNISGLFACGETACTGVHGANRLASNSLLEALVFANRAAQIISAGSVEAKSGASFGGKQRESAEYSENLRYSENQKYLENLAYRANNELLQLLPVTSCDFTAEKTRIQAIMRKYAGIIRSTEGLQLCSQELTEIEKILQQKKCLHKEYLECSNILGTAKLITGQALKRKQSIGAHYLK